MRLLSVHKLCRLLPPNSTSCYYSYSYYSTKTSTPGEGIAKSYNAAATEESVRLRWKSAKNERLNKTSFHDDDVFRIILPPPNITGKLHIGHALTVAIQDSIIRWKLMNGCSVKWIPGFDHAGIATQSVVLRKLQGKPEDGKNNPNPVTVSTEELVTKLQEFAEQNRKNISGQLDRLGALLDWDSAYYTLDQEHTNVVEEAFITLFESGLIRRASGMVNWCPTLRSSIADVECVPVEFEGKTTLRVPGHKQLVEVGCLYFVDYPLDDGAGSIQVATSRPETIFADAAIAVHPEDSRLSGYIGKTVRNPLNNQQIPIIGDNRVKPEFGTGALKVTPAHDKTDFKIGVDHNLPIHNVFTEDGRMTEDCQKLAGLGRFAARKAVIKILQEGGRLAAVKDYKGSIDICSRTGDIIEPRILPHWFLLTRGLTEKIVTSIANNELSIHPDYQKQVLLHRLANAHDWCLSRQIQWGHKIPAYYHKDHPDVWVSAFNKQSALQKLELKLSKKIEDSSEIRQDEDVLDTWFSSALIPLAVSNWPELDSKDFKELSLMETGADIVLFWVWRMAMMNLALAGRLPFRHVILHGIVTDPYGRKMSKSRGNVIDPLHVIEGRSFDELIKDAEKSYQEGELDKNEYKLRIAALKKDYPKGFSMCGADALRLALLSQDIYKQEIKLDVVYLENCRHFMNKIWQAMRFYFMHADKGINHPTEITKPDKNLVNSVADRWILACLYKFCCTMETNVPSCRFHVCVDAIREILYQQFCDVYIELIKLELKDGINAELRVLLMRYFFGTVLKLSHPFLPYITEEMWQHITGGNYGLLIDNPYPNSEELVEFKDPKLLNVMDKCLKIVSEVRSLRNKAGVDRKSTMLAYVEAVPKEAVLPAMASIIESLSNSKVLLESPSRTTRSNLVTNIVDIGPGQSCRVSAVRLNGNESSSAASPDPVQVFKLKVKLAKLTEKLNSPNFLKYADDHSKEELKRKVEEIKTQIESINEPTTSTKNS